MSSQKPENYTPENIAGKRAIVTGGTTGIGFATAKLLLERGARVLIFGRGEEDLQSTLDQLKQYGEVHGITADQAKLEDVQRVFQEADAKLGGLDILVNNAAISGKPMKEAGAEDLLYIVNVNVGGVVACCKEALNRMKTSGHIITIGSMSAETKSEDDEVYGASKAFVKAYCEALRKSINPDGVKVSLIEPGLVNTPILELEPEELAKKQAEHKIIEAEDIAESVHYVLTQPARCSVVEVQIRPIGQAI